MILKLAYGAGNTSLENLKLVPGILMYNLITVVELAGHALIHFRSAVPGPISCMQ